jgi:hypothetical protein
MRLILWQKKYTPLRMEELDLKKRTESIYTVQTVENKIGSNRSRSKSEEKKTDLRKLNFLETVSRELRYVPV